LLHRRNARRAEPSTVVRGFEGADRANADYGPLRALVAAAR
jgi:hypothetical protein